MNKSRCRGKEAIAAAVIRKEASGVRSCADPNRAVSRKRRPDRSIQNPKEEEHVALVEELFQGRPRILTGALLTTGGVSLVEAHEVENDCWHHYHEVNASTENQAGGKCAYDCSTQGHSDSQVDHIEAQTWECECRS